MCGQALNSCRKHSKDRKIHQKFKSEISGWLFLTLPLLAKPELLMSVLREREQRATLFPMKVSACAFLGVCVWFVSLVYTLALMGSRHTHTQCTLIFSAVTPAVYTSLQWTAKETYMTHWCNKSNAHRSGPLSLSLSVFIPSNLLEGDLGRVFLLDQWSLDILTCFT